MTIEQGPTRRVELNWFDYFCQRADFDRVHVLMLIQVDLTFATRASDLTFDASKADPALTWCTTMRVPLRDPEAFAGMASAAEADLLDLLADRLEAAANAYAPGILGRLRGRTPRLRARYVGCETGRGVRTLVFYSTDSIPGEVYKTALSSSPGLRAYSISSAADRQPDLATYRDNLHPRGALRSLILTEAQLETLREHGDRGDPREVAHDLTFPSAEARQAFIQSSKNKTARTLTPWPEPVAGDNNDSPRYGVTAHITHFVTRMSLGIYVVELALEAAHHGGTYEGWGTMVSEGSSAD